MSLYKFINESTIEAAPRFVKKDGMIIANPSARVLKELGYKPLADGDIPKYDPETQELKAIYTDEDAAITRSWEVIQSTKVPTAEERLTAVEEAVVDIAAAVYSEV